MLCGLIPLLGFYELEQLLAFRECGGFLRGAGHKAPGMGDGFPPTLAVCIELGQSFERLQSHGVALPKGRIAQGETLKIHPL
ncbi:MAG: hypothetical protein ACI8PQ_001768 [Planctomycetota bacterium]|jgi:hypothetical protein